MAKRARRYSFEGRVRIPYTILISDCVVILLLAHTDMYIDVEYHFQASPVLYQ